MKRYIEFDIIRTFVMLLMPIAHIIDIFLYYSVSTEEALAPFFFLNYLAGLGAASFMICMGINLNITRRCDSRSLVRRSFVLVAAAVVLNLLRYILPGILCSFLFNDTSMLEISLYSSVASDILYFAAIYMLFMALMKFLNFGPLSVVCIAALMSIVDYLIPNHHYAGHQLLEGVVGNFLFIDQFSSFAFLQWAIIPSIGYAFGHYLKRATLRGEEETIWRVTAGASIIIALLLILSCRLVDVDILSIIGNQQGTYNMSLVGAIIIAGIAFAVMYCVHIIASHIHSGRLKSFFMNLSKGITIYYMLQWILVVWGAAALYALGFDGNSASLSTSQVLIFYLLVTSICSAATFILQNRKSYRNNKRRAVR